MRLFKNYFDNPCSVPSTSKIDTMVDSSYFILEPCEFAYSICASVLQSVDRLGRQELVQGLDPSV